MHYHIPDWHDEALARIEELEALAVELRDALREALAFGAEKYDGVMHYKMRACQAALAKANKELGD